MTNVVVPAFTVFLSRAMKNLLPFSPSVTPTAVPFTSGAGSAAGTFGVTSVTSPASPSTVKGTYCPLT